MNLLSSKRVFGNMDNMDHMLLVTSLILSFESVSIEDYFFTISISNRPINRYSKLIHISKNFKVLDLRPHNDFDIPDFLVVKIIKNYSKSGVEDIIGDCYLVNKKTFEISKFDMFLR